MNAALWDSLTNLQPEPRSRQSAGLFRQTDVETNAPSKSPLARARVRRLRLHVGVCPATMVLRRAGMTDTMVGSAGGGGEGGRYDVDVPEMAGYGRET